MTQVLVLIIFLLNLSKFAYLVNLFLFEKMTNHGMTLRFDEIHGKEIGKKKKAVKIGHITDWIKYKRLRNKVNNQRKHAKESFYNNLELIITDFENNDKRKFWKVIRHFVKNNSSSSAIPPLSSTLPSGETQWAFTDEAKADCLNDYFVSISTVNDENTVLPPFEKLTNNSLSTVNCTENEIEHLINVLNINKASGDDGISHRMLK